MNTYTDLTNKDTKKSNYELDLSAKENMHLFSFSLLKSKRKLSLSKTNIFNHKFNIKDNDDLSFESPEKGQNKNNNRKISIIEGDNNSSLKTLNIEVPTSENLQNQIFCNDFMEQYDTSFANYCGIDKNQYTDIYINNRYIPKIDEFGDISISIRSIIDLLKTYSIKEKAGKKVQKKHRFKKIFKTLRKKTITEKAKKNKYLFEVLNIIKNKIDPKSNSNSDNNTLDSMKNDNFNLITIKDRNENNINSSNKPTTGLGLSHKLKTLRDKGKNLSLLIPGMKPNNIGIDDIKQRQNITINNNNNYIFNFNPLTSYKMPHNINPMQFGFRFQKQMAQSSDAKQKMSLNGSGNIFNFSQQSIQHFQKLPNINVPNPQNLQNRKFVNPIINNKNNDNSTLLNTFRNNLNDYPFSYNNNLLGSPLLSPIFPLYPFSPILPHSGIPSPRIISPNLNNSNIFSFMNIKK